jgi:hypothetical protein
MSETQAIVAAGAEPSRVSDRASRPAVSVVADGASRDHRWILASLLTVGTILRVSGVQRLPFEQDELYTIFDSSTLRGAATNVRPLYYLIQHGLSLLLPVSHVTVRLLPVLFGVLGIWVTWLLARRVVGRAGAIIATSVVTLSPWHLNASGMARYWSLVYLLSALFLLFMYDAGRYGRPRDYAAALITLLLGAATHPSFLFPMAGVALGFSLVREDGRLRFPWEDMQTWVRVWIPAAAVGSAAFLIVVVARGSGIMSNEQAQSWAASARLLPAMIEWMTPVVATAGALGALVLCASSNGPQRRRWGMVILLGAASGVAALLAMSLVTRVYAAYAMALLPLVFVAVGALAAEGERRLTSGQGYFVLASGLVLAAGVAPGAVSHLSDGTRFDYRPAFRAVVATAPDRPVLSWPIAVQRYYAPELRGIELRFNGRYLDGVLRRERDIWVIVPVVRYGIWLDEEGELRQWLIDRCRLHSSTQRSRLDYRLYRTDLYRCAGATS